jgi:cystathionine beta-lyase/cystathionine gamma-synthase
MSKTYKHIETKLIHAGEPEPRIGGAVSMPIFQSAMFEYGGETDYHDLKYIRLNNTPNHDAVHAKLAALENAEAAIVTASGMAAISTALLTVLSAGDHLLAQSSLYGGTHDFITKDFADLGLTYDFIDANDPGSWQEKLRPNTKAIYVETMTNPLVEVGDLKAVASFAGENNLVSLIDNTFASPINFRPAEYGYDISLHSATKYLNGHSDIVAGACIGSSEIIGRIKKKLDHFGGSMDPHAVFLLHRGMKTLALRMGYQNESAMRIAHFLESHPAIDKVNHPGLESSRGHRHAAELFDGFGGMLSFEIKGNTEVADEFIRKVSLPIVAPSLGGVETLITRPAITSHAGMSSEDREALGISDRLIRLSVGIESTEDLIADLDQALQAASDKTAAAA